MSNTELDKEVFALVYQYGSPFTAFDSAGLTKELVQLITQEKIKELQRLEDGLRYIEQPIKENQALHDAIFVKNLYDYYEQRTKELKATLKEGLNE